MTSALSDEEVQEIYGSMRLILHECPAAKIRILAGAAGWDIGQIPDGMDETGQGTRRPPQESAIDGQWSTWDPELKRRRLKRLAEVLLERASEANVQRELLKSGFRFVSGDFVPVNAQGEIEP
jgi:hypothetical protein